jgi:hypothetical protein
MILTNAKPCAGRILSVSAALLSLCNDLQTAFGRADTRTAGGLTGPALEAIRHRDERFYELLADGRFARLIV